MQTAPIIQEWANKDLAPIAWQLRAAFTKQFDPDVTFFTLDQSLLDGPDILAPTNSDVVAEWDKYEYTDYSDRVVSIEVTREILQPSSMVQAFADITLKNEDDYFTPKSGSPIEDYILPMRPFRILMGFGNEVVPKFVGLNEGMPTINKKDGTAKFHLVDFLSFVLDREIGDSEMLLNKRTDEILSYLFQEVGLSPDQFTLDSGFNTIPFFYVRKGDKLRKVVQDLMVAEQGTLYLDELGRIIFRNSQNYSSDPVYTFNELNTNDYDVSDEDNIINYAKFTVNILQVMSEQSIYESADRPYISIGDSIEVWANLEDPVTSVTDPVYAEIQESFSHYIATEDEAGTIPYPDIALTNLTSFGTALVMTFENTGASNGYLQSIDVWGTPVKTVDTILVEDFDQASIDDFGERVYELETNYIQDEDTALSKAAILISDYKDYGSSVSIDVKGSPALQLLDATEIDLDGYQGNHVITKMIEGMQEGRYWQRLQVLFKEPKVFFILDQSLLDGPDLLAP